MRSDRPPPAARASGTGEGEIEDAEKAERDFREQGVSAEEGCVSPRAGGSRQCWCKS